MNPTASYTLSFAGQGPSAPPPIHAPTLAALEAEHARLSALRDDLRDSIREAERFVRDEQPGRLIARRIGLAVARMTEQLAEIRHDLGDIEREMREQEMLHYGWMNCPSEVP